MAKTAAEYKTEHESLMIEWKKRHEKAGYKAFIKDGVVNPELWFAQEQRVLFILKEAYSNEAILEDADISNDLKEYETSKGRIWNAVAEWTAGLMNTTMDSIPYFDNWLGVNSENFNEYTKVRADILKKCAVINIKKSNGKNPSNDDDLLKYVMEDGDLLARQIEVINPTIIVCGSTFHLLKDIKNKKNPDKNRSLEIFGEDTSLISDVKGCYMIKERPTIAYYHPANQYPAVLCFYGLMGMYHYFLKNR